MKTLNEILTESVNNNDNINDDGSINWSFVDSDLWLHEDGKHYSDEEKRDALNEFADNYDRTFENTDVPRRDVAKVRLFSDDGGFDNALYLTVDVGCGIVQQYVQINESQHFTIDINNCTGDTDRFQPNTYYLVLVHKYNDNAECDEVWIDLEDTHEDQMQKELLADAEAYEDRMSNEERMDGLVKIKDLNKLRNAMYEITEEFLEEGFASCDIVDWIQQQAVNTFNKLSEENRFAK